jgi:hypothetical protein
MRCRFRVEGNCSDQGAEAAKLIKNAALIANLFFKSDEAKLAYDKLGAKASFVEKCKNLKFVFKTGQETKQKWTNSYGTTERKVDASHIFINVKLLNRYSQIFKSKRKPYISECGRIELFVAFIILHELGHLVQRWQNILDTPERFANKEAGDFVEVYLNSGRIMGLRLKRPAAIASGCHWTGSEEISGLVCTSLGGGKSTLVPEDYPAMVFARRSVDKPRFHDLLPIPCEPYSKLIGHYHFAGKSHKRNRNSKNVPYGLFIKCGIAKVQTSTKTNKRY